LIVVLTALLLPASCCRAEEEALPALLHDAMAGALAGQPGQVSSIREVMEEDQTEDPASWSGVLDDVAVSEILSASLSQKEKAERLHDLAKDINDPVARERILALANRVEEYHLEDLTHKRRLNKVTGVVNRAWRTTSQVIAGQPRALAVAGVDTFFALTGRKAPDMTDKKLAYLAKMQEIRGEATPEELAEGRELIGALEQRRRKSELRIWKARVEEAMDTGFWVRADRLCTVGGNLWPEEPWFSQTQTEIAEEVAREKQAGPRGQVDPITEEDRAKADLYRSQLAGEIRYQKAISDRDSREMIGTALAERRTKTLDYLLFGETRSSLVDRSTIRTAVQHGSDAPAAIGFLQGAETFIRGVSLLFGNELGLHQAIDTYAYIERSKPETLTEKDRKKWADLAAKAGDYREAIDILERGGVQDEKRVEGYREDWARAILDRCEQLPPGTDRFNALEFVQKEFPDTSAARRASDMLLKTPATDRPLVLVKRKFLLEYEPHLAAAGFRFDKSWWDGDKSNGEIAEEETYWDPQGAVWFRVAKKSPWRRIDQPEEHREQIQAVFSQIEEAILAEHLREERRGDRKFPVEIEGEIGSDTFVTPKFVQFDTSGPDDSLFE
jgi:hypothetical protein